METVARSALLTSILFDWSYNFGAIDLKMDGSFLRKNHVSRRWDCLSHLNWTGALTLSPLLKLSPRKLGP